MAAQIDSTKPLHVKLIHLANGDTLEDKTAFILNCFLIVEADNPEQAPTWYNLQNVEALQEVTIPEQPAKPQQRIVRWL